MVNSGSFDSDGQGDRNAAKVGFTQPHNTTDGTQSSSPVTASAATSCKGGFSQTADSSDLPIEPTPTKTEFNSDMPVENFTNLSSVDGSSEESEKASLCCSVPLDKVQGVLTTYHKGEDKVKRKLLCLYCDRSFGSANLRQKHVERVHSVKQNRRVSSRRQNQLTVTPCAYCDKLNGTENTLKDLFQHLLNEHSSRYFGCLPCEDRFPTSSLLADHNADVHQNTTLETSSSSVESFSSSDSKTTLRLTQLDEIQLETQESEVSVKITRSRMKPKSDDDDKRAIITTKKKSTKLKEMRAKKMSVKSSRIALKRRESKRLQAIAKLSESQKKRRPRPTLERKQTVNKTEPTHSTKLTDKTKSNSTCINPYPEFDHFYRVKKITDHSIDNLKISSLTFDDVFDKAFFNRIKCNIEENLLHHIDGKLFKNEESESRISNFEKISTAPQEIQNSNSENYGCELSLNAVTPVASLSLNSQFGEDFESQIEYGSKPSKKKTQTKKDEIHYKYFTRRKYQASILEHKENRDLSKLDMWTQLVIKKRQQKMVDEKKTPREMLEYTSCDEYKNKLRREELNRILDRRGPFEDLKEEASKKAALDKLNSASEDSISHESFTDVREVLNEILNRVFAVTEESNNVEVQAEVVTQSKKHDQREIPSYLNLRRSSSLPSEGEIDKSDKIALICSSQETENFELPTNQVRGKNELIELTGEWARCRMYICAACGAKLPNMRFLLEHKSMYHQNVWVQHYEFVGNQSELYRHLSIPTLGKVGAVEDSVQCKLWKRSEARLCTKCGRQCNSLGELHRHILECGGDWTWMLARKKCKYRPFGAKSRRKRRGLVRRIHHKQKTEPTEKKVYKKFDGPRQRPSDADTIQRMLANLPAKRSTRKLISLQDGIYRARKNTQIKSLNKNKIKCGKVIYKSSRHKETTEKTINTATNSKKVTLTSSRRSLRSLNKVLSSRILDTTSSLNVKRKLKVLNERRRTRQSLIVQEEEKEVSNDETVEETIVDSSIPPKKDDVDSESTENVSKRKSPRSSPKNLRKKLSVKNLLTGKLNIKSFFPVKKRKTREVTIENSNPEELEADVQTRSKRKSKESVDTTEEKIEENPVENNINVEVKKKKNEKFTRLVRRLSIHKKKEKSIESSVDKNPSKEKEPEVKPAVESEKSSKKRKLKQSFRNVINRVKKLKIDSAPENTTVEDQPPKKQINHRGPFLEEGKVDNPEPPAQAEKIIIPTALDAKENIADVSTPAPIVMNFHETNENPISETIFKLESNNEKNLQAKGELDFDTQPATENAATKMTVIEPPKITEPITVETSVKPKIVPMISPNMKGKIRKPARGLNDCIAMLTSKLQQKNAPVEENTKVNNVVNLLTPTNAHDTFIEAPPKTECILRIPTFKTHKIYPEIEETALDLSTKSNRDKEFPQALIQEQVHNNTETKTAMSPKKTEKLYQLHKISSLPKLNSVDKIIEEVVENRRWNSVDDIIQKVISSHTVLENKAEPRLFLRNSIDDIIDFVVHNNANYQSLDDLIKGNELMEDLIVKTIKKPGRKIGSIRKPKVKKSDKTIVTVSTEVAPTVHNIDNESILVPNNSNTEEAIQKLEDTNSLKKKNKQNKKIKSPQTTSVDIVPKVTIMESNGIESVTKHSIQNNEEMEQWFTRVDKSFGFLEDETIPLKKKSKPKNKNSKNTASTVNGDCVLERSPILSCNDTQTLEYGSEDPVYKNIEEMEQLNDNIPTNCFVPKIKSSKKKTKKNIGKMNNADNVTDETCFKVTDHSIEKPVPTEDNQSLNLLRNSYSLKEQKTVENAANVGTIETTSPEKDKVVSKITENNENLKSLLNEGFIENPELMAESSKTKKGTRKLGQPRNLSKRKKPVETKDTSDKILLETNLDNVLGLKEVNTNPEISNTFIGSETMSKSEEIKQLVNEDEPQLLENKIMTLPQKTNTILTSDSEDDIPLSALAKNDGSKVDIATSVINEKILKPDDSQTEKSLEEINNKKILETVVPRKRGRPRSKKRIEEILSNEEHFAKIDTNTAIAENTSKILNVTKEKLNKAGKRRSRSAKNTSKTELNVINPEIDGLGEKEPNENTLEKNSTTNIENDMIQTQNEEDFSQNINETDHLETYQIQETNIDMEPDSNFKEKLTSNSENKEIEDSAIQILGVATDEAQNETKTTPSPKNEETITTIKENNQLEGINTDAEKEILHDFIPPSKKPLRRSRSLKKKTEVPKYTATFENSIHDNLDQNEHSTNWSDVTPNKRRSRSKSENLLESSVALSNVEVQSEEKNCDISLAESVSSSSKIIRKSDPANSTNEIDVPPKAIEEPLVAEENLKTVKRSRSKSIHACLEIEKLLNISTDVESSDLKLDNSCNNSETEDLKAIVSVPQTKIKKSKRNVTPKNKPLNTKDNYLVDTGLETSTEVEPDISDIVQTTSNIEDKNETQVEEKASKNGLMETNLPEEHLPISNTSNITQEEVDFLNVENTATKITKNKRRSRSAKSKALLDSKKEFVTDEEDDNCINNTLKDDTINLEQSCTEYTESVTVAPKKVNKRSKSKNTPVVGDDIENLASTELQPKNCGVIDKAGTDFILPEVNTKKKPRGRPRLTKIVISEAKPVNKTVNIEGTEQANINQDLNKTISIPKPKQRRGSLKNNDKTKNKIEHNEDTSINILNKNDTEINKSVVTEEPLEKTTPQVIIQEPFNKDKAILEPPIKIIINKQKTRRKSKSFKKADLKGQNDLFEDFALVIKKPKRIFPVITYTPPKVFASNDTYPNYIKKPIIEQPPIVPKSVTEESPAEEPIDLDASVEEMDMELDEIPIVSNIIERNTSAFVASILESPVIPDPILKEIGESSPDSGKKTRTGKKSKDILVEQSQLPQEELFGKAELLLGVRRSSRIKSSSNENVNKNLEDTQPKDSEFDLSNSTEEKIVTTVLVEDASADVSLEETDPNNKNKNTIKDVFVELTALNKETTDYLYDSDVRRSTRRKSRVDEADSKIIQNSIKEPIFNTDSLVNKEEANNANVFPKSSILKEAAVELLENTRPKRKKSKTEEADVKLTENSIERPLLVDCLVNQEKEDALAETNIENLETIHDFIENTPRKSRRNKSRTEELKKINNSVEIPILTDDKDQEDSKFLETNFPKELETLEDLLEDSPRKTKKNNKSRTEEVKKKDDSVEIPVLTHSSLTNEKENAIYQLLESDISKEFESVNGSLEDSPRKSRRKKSRTEEPKKTDGSIELPVLTDTLPNTVNEDIVYKCPESDIPRELEIVDLLEDSPRKSRRKKSKNEDTKKMEIPVLEDSLTDKEKGDSIYNSSEFDIPNELEVLDDLLEDTPRKSRRKKEAKLIEPLVDKEKDVESIYAFTESEDIEIEKPIEKPKRKTKKQSKLLSEVVDLMPLDTDFLENDQLPSETNILQSALGPEKNADLSEEINTKSAAKRKSRHNTSLETPEETTKTTDIKENSIILDQQENGRRKSVRSAKVKALEHIHDEALAELTESERNRDLDKDAIISSEDNSPIEGITKKRTNKRTSRNQKAQKLPEMELEQDIVETSDLIAEDLDGSKQIEDLENEINKEAMTILGDIPDASIEVIKGTVKTQDMYPVDSDLVKEDTTEEDTERSRVEIIKTPVGLTKKKPNKKQSKAQKCKKTVAATNEKTEFLSTLADDLVNLGQLGKSIENEINVAILENNITTENQCTQKQMKKPLPFLTHSEFPKINAEESKLLSEIVDDMTKLQELDKNEDDIVPGNIISSDENLKELSKDQKLSENCEVEKDIADSSTELSNIVDDLYRLQDKDESNNVIANEKTKALSDIVDDFASLEEELRKTIEGEKQANLTEPPTKKKKVNKKTNKAKKLLDNLERLDIEKSEILSSFVDNLTGLTELENSIENELKTGLEEDKLKDVQENLQSEENNQELRRSRRGSRKVTSYNENDLVDPLLDEIDGKRKGRKKEKSEENITDNKKAIKEQEKKLNSDELFDLLKASSNDMFTAKSQTSFLNLDDTSKEFNNENFDNVFENILEKSTILIQNTNDKNEEKDVDKIYEFTESPENTEDIKNMLQRKNKKAAKKNVSASKLQTEDSLNAPASDGIFSAPTTPDPNVDSKSKTKAKPNYCEICNKSFIRVENLVKHKRTLTHIQKLSEIEAKQAAEKSKEQPENDSVKESDPIVEPTTDSAKVISDLSKNEININDILNETERREEPQTVVHSSFPNNQSLKLADIINDVLNKPVLENDGEKCNNFSDVNFQNNTEIQPEYRRYKSLGERKSFDSEPLEPKQMPIEETFESKTTILEKQISLLENIIENQTGVNYIDDISMSSNNSVLENNSAADSPSELSLKQDDSSNVTYTQNNLLKPSTDDSFLKPSQYEEISEDSVNLRNYEDQKLRKTLNRDEELFLECCSLLKSGSEVSSYSNRKSHNKVFNSMGLKQCDEPEWLERKCLVQKPAFEMVNDYSDDNSRIPTPLGDSYDDDASNSNTISSNWNMNKKVPVFEDITQEKSDVANKSFTFEEVLNECPAEEQIEKEKSGISKFGGILAKTIKNQVDAVSKLINKKPLAVVHEGGALEKQQEEVQDASANDNKKIITKGARKVFEGLKVSIPTEELNLEEVLNCSPKAKKLELTNIQSPIESPKIPDDMGSSQNKPSRTARKSKPVKNKSQFGSNLLFKMNKKKVLSPNSGKMKDDEVKTHDIYDFEETQDNTDVFTKPDFRTFRNMKTSETVPELESDTESRDYMDSFSAQSIASSISSSSSKKPKTQENITKKKCMIMGRIFKNAAAKSKIEDIDEEIRDIPAIDNSELVESYVANCKKIIKNEGVTKPKLSEKEINMLFDQLLEEKCSDKESKTSVSTKTTAKAKTDVKKVDNKKKLKPKGKKRVRTNSESTDDEFSLNKTNKKRNRKNGKEEDNCINLEQELKECIGVASRKSQRKCTSGKQNVLVEYWSSDDSQFEALLESQRIESRQSNKAEESTNLSENVIVPSISENLPENPVEQLLPPETTEKPQKPKKPQQKKKPSEKKAKGAADGKSADAAMSNRRKRAAANPLYHWSSSSEDEAQDLIEVKPVRDELEDDEDRPVQHGWIVGDSPKKLVTMLAQAKGKKTDIDCVKEQGKKRTTAVS